MIQKSNLKDNPEIQHLEENIQKLTKIKTGQNKLKIVKILEWSNLIE